MKKLLYLSIIISFLAPMAGFAKKGRALQWKKGEITFEGLYLKGKKGMPGVVIYHQWMGLTDHEKDIARDLNELGYHVLAADVYGKDNRPKDRSEAPQIAGAFYKDRQKLRDHSLAALQAFLKETGLKSKDTYAIGYCFGGSTILELGRTGTPLKGLVSLHGGLSNPHPADDEKIHSPLLILHGAEDQVVPWTDVTALVENLRALKKDFSLHVFAHAVHGFTHKHDPRRYNQSADEQSWDIMLSFFSNH